MPIEVLYLLLGWFLGLMSPLITERIRNVLLRRRVGKAFKTELTTLRYRLMCAVQQMAEQNGRLAKPKVPAQLLLLDELPRNVMGKVNKPELRKLFE